MLLADVGGGKGKTTVGLGVALRAWGHGYRVLAAFMMKTPLYMGEEVGEYKALRRLGIDVIHTPGLGYERDFALLAAYAPAVVTACDIADLTPSHVLKLTEIGRAHV